MDTNFVTVELKRLNGPPPPFNPKQDPKPQIQEWISWNGAEALIAKWEEQCNKRTAGARSNAKRAASTSMTGPVSRDYINRPGTW